MGETCELGLYLKAARRHHLHLQAQREQDLHVIVSPGAASVAFWTRHPTGSERIWLLVPTIPATDDDCDPHSEDVECLAAGRSATLPRVHDRIP